VDKDMKKKLADLGELVFKQVDNLGYQLDAIGVENQINRHVLIAKLFAGQKRFEGEMDSIKARTESTKAQVEATIDAAEKLAKSGFDLVTFPATYTYSRLKQLA
jgi:hypothetical protein